MNGSPALTKFRRAHSQGCQGEPPTPWATDHRAPRPLEDGGTGSGIRARSTPPPPSRAFTLIDVLVSIAVIAVLISILMPSLSLVRETTRRLICASNTRQIGLGLAMYAEDYQTLLPPTRFDAHNHAHRLMTVRVGETADWDGIGWLYASNYLDAPQVYYCPSYRGENTYLAFADRWRGTPGEVLANYHYRGRLPNRTFLMIFSEPTVAILADGMRSRADFSHKVGTNVLKIDLSVVWFSDANGQLAASLPTGQEGDLMASTRVGQAWQMLDQSGGTAPGW